MNLLNKKKLFKKGIISIESESNGYVISNDSDYSSIITFPIFFRRKADDVCNIEFNGFIDFGDTPELKLVNRKKKTIYNLDFNSNTTFNVPARLFIVAIKVMPKSKFHLKTLNINFNSDIVNTIEKNFVGDTLLIAPGYPSFSNKYLFGFVHTRVLEYKKNNWNIDVAYLNSESSYCNYIYEDVKVNKISYFDLRNLLQVKKYKRIIVHFFTDEVAQILDATDISDTDVFIFTHGSDILYRDINLLTAPYFTPIMQDTDEQKKKFLVKDKLINRYNEMPNVKFIFASEWAKNRSEEQNKISFNNYDVIPTFIDENMFKYDKKNSDLRKKIVIIRKFDNINTYSIDLDVLTILELSKRKCFSDMEFDIYGDGNFHSELLKPLMNFENVHIYKKFLSHDEIAAVHKTHGIGLFATRYETQGVSAAEAAMSGLVVVSNDVAAVPEMFGEFGTLAKKNDYVEMANIIEDLYNNPKKFLDLSAKMHDAINKKYGYDSTMKRELKILENRLPRKKYNFKKLASNKILSIAVASYNVEKFLYNSVESLINSSVAEKLEILIINDGSKDNTGKIAKKLQKMTTVDDDSIVKFVDKENGGHGSAINKGIELATGKYFKLMDGDDYFDTEELEKLVKYLEKDDTDIVLNNYVEDLSVPCKFNTIRHYDFMEPGKEYNIEDLCYEGYGFDNWGPLLSTSTYRTQMLKDANFKISEHCFYVDMELNSIAFTCAKTIKYYPLDIYVYYLGRVGQSVSAASFKKNYKHHENVTIRIINDIYYARDLSEQKKNYLKKKIILPLIRTQYMIVIDYFSDGKPFMEFDSRLSQFPEFYNDNTVVNRRIKLYRITNGKFVRLIKFLSDLKNKIIRR